MDRLWPIVVRRWPYFFQCWLRRPQLDELLPRNFYVIEDLVLRRSAAAVVGQVAAKRQAGVMGGPAVGNTPFGDATYFWLIRGPLSLIVSRSNYLRERGSLPCVGGPPKVSRSPTPIPTAKLRWPFFPHP